VCEKEKRKERDFSISDASRFISFQCFHCVTGTRVFFTGFNSDSHSSSLSHVKATIEYHIVLIWLTELTSIVLYRTALYCAVRTFR
jgi:hypothetical protein